MSKKLQQVVLSLVLLTSMLLSMATPALAQTPPPPDGPSIQPTITYAAQHDMSAPLTEMATWETGTPAQLSAQPSFSLPKGLKAPAESAAVDAVIQDTPIISTMPDLVANFDGVDNIGGVAPPDTNGDIGYDPGTGNKYYVQWVNLHLQAWNVNDPANPVPLFAAPIAGNTIWNGFGGRCQSDNSGDPIVLYDELANRWFISQFSVSSAPYYNCIAVSVTSDPSGAYYRYAYIYSNTKMNDYPKYGIWPDGYYMTVNQFTNASSWGGAGVAVYERDQMLIGGTARQVIFDLYGANINFGGMLPSDFEGTPPPAGTPAYFAEVDDSSYGLGAVDEMRIWQFNTNWTTNTFSFGLSNQPNQILPVADFNLICGSTRLCVPQPGTTQKVDAIGDRLMYRLAYRLLDDGSEHMVVNHSVNAGSNRAAVRWYELVKTAGSWAIAQQATYAGDVPASDTIHRWMGSIGMDRMGNIALGYSVSNATSQYPGLGLVGRLTGDPANTLPQGERIAFSGTTSQTDVERWGDYSSMSIDPQDGCTFWFTSEYSSGSWEWRTRIVSFKYPTCSALPTGTISGTVTDSVSGDPIPNANVTAGAYGTIAGLDGTYTLNVPIGTYAMTASGFAHLPGSASDVIVTEAATTTVDFALAPAPLVEVYGTVTDATVGGHSWPLYARITIADYPYGDIFTNPQTGAYSVMLPANSTLDFTVDGMLPGYNSLAQTVNVLATATQADFSLLANQVTCNAPGYVIVGNFLENFDAPTAPALPANWAFVRTGGTNATTAWKTNVGTRYPSGTAAVSSPNVAYFNSYSVTTGNAARLYYTQPFDMTTVAPAQVSLKMFHDTGYSTSHDTLLAQVSIDGGTNWINVGSPIDRVGTSAQWLSHTIDLSAYASQTNLLIGFNVVSAYGNDVHIDDVLLGTPPVCTTQVGALAMGYVTDANTTLELNGATISDGAAAMMTAAATEDPALDEGFYYGFVQAGAAVDLSGSMLKYADDVHTLAITNDTVLWQDFALDAGQLSVAPAGFDVTLPPGGLATRFLSLSNTGAVALNFSITEIDAPVTTVVYDPVFAPVLRHLGPKNLNKSSLDDVMYYWDVPADAYQPYVSEEAGSLISSFESGLGSPYGVGYDQANNTLWVGSMASGTGDDQNHEFTLDGTATNRTIDTHALTDAFAADMAYDPAHGTFWQVAVAGENCIFEFDPDTSAPTGAKICPAFGISERGLAYDPITDTFFAGSWNDRLIKRFDRSGEILEQKNVDLPIAGLAYNPASGHLFVANHSILAPYNIQVLDVNNAYENLGGFSVPELDAFTTEGVEREGEAGLELDCSGNLWAVNQYTGRILQIASGEGGVCSVTSILWLSTDPTLGDIAPAASMNVTLTFDATGLALGTYQAQLQLVNNTPYTVANIPVTLHVIEGNLIYLPVINR